MGSGHAEIEEQIERLRKGEHFLDHLGVIGSERMSQVVLVWLRKETQGKLQRLACEIRLGNENKKTGGNVVHPE